MAAAMAAAVDQHGMHAAHRLIVEGGTGGGHGSSSPPVPPVEETGRAASSAARVAGLGLAVGGVAVLV
jgi:hypothetical protein